MRPIYSLNQMKEIEKLNWTKRTNRTSQSVRIVVRTILTHLACICALSMLTFQVLDWYNPYMDFLGTARSVLDVLCVSTILASVLRL